ncbi:MAG TPA: STAS domain-containing protein [Candidatus Limnocylindrales bacterium]
MNVTVERMDARVPVTVLRLEGDLDASNFEDLIERGRQLYEEGTRYLLLDMRAVPYMGSSGLVALHALTLILLGESLPDTDSGWEAHRAIARSVESGMQGSLKVLLDGGPGSTVRRVFERTGMNRFIELHEDEAAALASF